MTAHEFAVRAWMQYYGIGAPEAERLVSEAEARGGGTGPHYENGVRADEVGKPIKVGFEVSQKTGGEAADEQARAEQLKGLPQPERSAVDVEADRRFWTRTGMDTGKKLTTGAADASNRALWMQTRDEVMRDLATSWTRCRSARATSCSRAAGRSHTSGIRRGPADRRQDQGTQRRRVGALPAADQHLHRRLRQARTVDRPLQGAAGRRAQDRGARGRDGATVEALQRMEEAPQVVHQHRGLGRATPRQSPQFVKQYEDATKALDQALKAANFKDLAEYDAACAEYLLLFKKRAVEWMMLALNASERVVRSELAREQGPGRDAGRLRPTRGPADYLGSGARRGLSLAAEVSHGGIGGGVGWYDKRTPAQEAAHEEWKEHVKRLEAERKAQSETANPILKDPELRTRRAERRPATSAGSLGRLLREDAEDRLAGREQDAGGASSEDAGGRCSSSTASSRLTLQELGAGPGSIGEVIVQGACSR